MIMLAANGSKHIRMRVHDQGRHLQNVSASYRHIQRFIISLVCILTAKESLQAVGTGEASPCGYGYICTRPAKAPRWFFGAVGGRCNDLIIKLATSSMLGV
jgi:hypothetical protein